MLNQALTYDLFSGGQVNRMIKTLDDWLQVYTEAVFIIFAIAMALLACLIFSEMTQSKATKKMPSNHQAPKEHHLLQTEP